MNKTFAKPQNKQSSTFFEFSKAPLLHKEGLGAVTPRLN
jgi:hypothetical protein